MFSNKDLKNLIVPLFMEQLLVMLVGIADVSGLDIEGDYLLVPVQERRMETV